MKRTKVTLIPLKNHERKQFILDNREAFKFGAVKEFGDRYEHFDEDGEIISAAEITEAMDAKGAETYRIYADGQAVGGVVLKINKRTHRNQLTLLFVKPEFHSRGIGYGAWLETEKMHPETEVWETCTPYFDKRNIHFYINKCGFHAIEFFNECHRDPSEADDEEGEEELMFRFEKTMKR